MIQNEFMFDDKEKSRRAGRAMQLLELLRQAPRTNEELSRLKFLRYGAYLHDLRLRGYDIRTEKGDRPGVWIYRAVGYREMVKRKPGMKQRYYNTTHWRNIRQQRLELDGYRCCHCRSTEGLHVHHWAYDIFEEDIEDIVTLCSNCHERIHAYPGVRVSFPDYITKDHAVILGGEEQ